MKQFTISSDPEPYPTNWPPETYVAYQQEVKREQLDGLRQLIEKKDVGETQMDKYLQDNPEIVVCLLGQFYNGHHASWIVPQQAIRSPQPEVIPGLKPDFILGGKSSDGFLWYVIELKAPKHALFSKKDNNLRLSSDANRGLIQLLEYIDYCSHAQAYLRDSLGLTNFREPKGILLIGNESEFEDDNRRQDLKADWNRNCPDLPIHTYDALIRAVEQKV